VEVDTRFKALMQRLKDIRKWKEKEKEKIILDTKDRNDRKVKDDRHSSYLWVAS